MFTIAIDEFGDFEAITPDNNKPMFLGGIIYNGDEKDTYNERIRIKAYYEAVIFDARISEGYPSALHSNGNRNRDTVIVKPVKQIVNITIGEFIKYGTYKGRELISVKRKGNYYIFLNLKSTRGISSLLGENTNILSKDGYAGNLYFHMSTQIINRLIFHNPVINIEPDSTFSLNLATRATSNYNGYDKKAIELEKVGYEKVIKNQIYFKIATSDIYRTAIAQEMISTNKHRIKIKDFNVCSINYRGNGNSMEFLFMADTICSYLSFNIYSNHLENINNRLSNINFFENNIIFAYDEVDSVYNKAYEMYENGDYYGALSVAFEIINYRTGKKEYNEFDRYYAEKWFPELVDKIKSQKSEKYYTKAVKRLHDEIMTNHLNNEKSLYIMNVLEDMIPSVSELYDDTESKDVFYYLYNVAVVLYCHIGDNRKVNYYYKKCKEYSDRVSVEKFLKTRNHLAAAMINNFQYELALKIVAGNIDSQIKLIKLYNNIPERFKKNKISSPELSKAYSLSGQIYSFMHNKHAEIMFLDALKGFTVTSADYKITQSYLLHHYLDMYEKEKYLQESQKYFGGKQDLSEQLEYIIESGLKESPIININFALYVWVKGLFLFRINELNTNFRIKLYNINEIINKREKRPDINKRVKLLYGHPCELIYKYIELIAISYGDIQFINYIENLRVNSIDDEGATLKLIRLSSEAEIENFRRNIQRRDELVKLAFEHFQNGFFGNKREIRVSQNNDEAYKILMNIVGYMYR